MRIVVAVLVFLGSASAWASSASTDVTMVIASPQESGRDVVPAYPSLFVHIGVDERQLPSFSRPDGTPISIGNAVAISNNLTRVDLDIGEGEIVVRLDHGDIPVATFTVDPYFRPRTRSVELRPTGTLRVDSDAVVFEIYGRGSDEVVFNDGTIFLTLGKRQRVIALYSNGTTEEIYDDVPREVHEDPDTRLVPDIRLKSIDLSPLPATLILLLVLGAIGLLAARTDVD